MFFCSAEFIFWKVVHYLQGVSQRQFGSCKSKYFENQKNYKNVVYDKGKFCFWVFLVHAWGHNEKTKEYRSGHYKQLEKNYWYLFRKFPRNICCEKLN